MSIAAASPLVQGTPNTAVHLHFSNSAGCTGQGSLALHCLHSSNILLKHPVPSLDRKITGLIHVFHMVCGQHASFVSGFTFQIVPLQGAQGEAAASKPKAVVQGAAPKSITNMKADLKKQVWHSFCICWGCIPNAIPPGTHLDVF